MDDPNRRQTCLDGWHYALIALVTASALGLGLGRAGRLTYHEAIVAQAAREMLADGDFLVPKIDGRPWLEKPPLGIWLVALTARLNGGVDEWAARFPSTVAGVGLVLAVAAIAAHRFGPEVGLLAGLVQATSAWTLIRGRLADSDMLLAAVLSGTLLAFDRLREEAEPGRAWRWLFFAGLGVSSLAKGIGFGAVLTASAIALTLLWDRDWRTLRRLIFVRGWLLTLVLTLGWPALVVWRHPAALDVWSLHITDRLATHPAHFAGGAPWWHYGPAVLWQVLPWTPLAVIGAGRSLARARAERGGPDRMLWAWAFAPLVLLSMATVKNAHYAIYALPPWSVWTALSLAKLQIRLEARGWAIARIRSGMRGAIAGLGLACGLAIATLGARFDHRGVEWAFYEKAGHIVKPREPLALLYDDWDRNPYPSPFGPFPHDLAIRLFYLNRPACWRQGIEALAESPPAPAPGSFAVIARDRDFAGLQRLGQVETLARGPRLRAHASRVDDRTFVLYRITPERIWRLAGGR